MDVSTGRPAPRAARRPCPACGGERAEAAGSDGGWVWLRCRRCRTTYVAAAVTQQDLDRFYADYYTPANLTVPPVVQARLREVVAGFAGHRRTGRLLDVGFGAGHLLAAAAEAGWECWGTEVSDSAVAAAAGAAWTTVAGDLPGLDLPAGSFDVVCLVELLEHVPDPLEQLAAAVRLLRPGGLLHATTPSGRGVSARLLGLRWSAFDAPEHLQLLSPAALADAARGAGLVDVRVETRGTNPYELRARLGRGGQDFSATRRVESGYALNSRLEASSRGRALKAGLNGALRLTRCGDSLVLRAQRAGG